MTQSAEHATDPQDRQRAEPTRQTLVVLVAILAVVAVGWALKAGYYVFMPTAFALFVALLVHPIQVWAARRLPERLQGLAVVFAMMVAVSVLAALAGAFWFSFSMIGHEIPRYVDRFRDLWAQATDWATHLGLPVSLSETAEQMKSGVAGYVAGLATYLWTTIGVFVLIFFLSLLMLLESGSWKKKVEAALSDPHSAQWLDTVGVITTRIRQYLAVRTLISFVSGIAAGAWLYLVGVEFALLWGLLTFVLNYLPNIGSVLSVVLPTAMAVLQFGYEWALVTIAGLTAIEQIIGNFLDPRLQGRTLDVSPLVVLVSILFWGWVWGIAGALLAVPLTVTVIIILSHTRALQPLAILLSRQPEQLASQDRRT